MSNSGGRGEDREGDCETPSPELVERLGTTAGAADDEALCNGDAATEWEWARLGDVEGRPNAGVAGHAGVTNGLTLPSWRDGMVNALAAADAADGMTDAGGEDGTDIAPVAAAGVAMAAFHKAAGYIVDTPPIVLELALLLVLLLLLITTLELAPLATPVTAAVVQLVASCWVGGWEKEEEAVGVEGALVLLVAAAAAVTNGNTAADDDDDDELPLLTAAVRLAAAADNTVNWSTGWEVRDESVVFLVVVRRDIDEESGNEIRWNVFGMRDVKRDFDCEVEELESDWVATFEGG